MEKYGQHDWYNYLFASKVCDAELTKRNRLHRMFDVELSSPDEHRVSQATRDSMGVFMHKFLDYINNNCCYAIYKCDSTNILGNRHGFGTDSKPAKAKRNK
jgi:hypothetical protein